MSTHLNHTTSPLNQISIQLRAHKRAQLSPGSATAHLLLSICIAYVRRPARGLGFMARALVLRVRVLGRKTSPCIYVGRAWGSRVLPAGTAAVRKNSS